MIDTVASSSKIKKGQHDRAARAQGEQYVRYYFPQGSLRQMIWPVSFWSLWDSIISLMCHDLFAYYLFK